SIFFARCIDDLQQYDRLIIRQLAPPEGSKFLVVVEALTAGVAHIGGGTTGLLSKAIASDHHAANFGVCFPLDRLDRNLVRPLDHEGRHADTVNGVDRKAIGIGARGPGERMQEPVVVELQNLAAFTDPTDVLMRKHPTTALRQLPKSKKLPGLGLQAQ